MTITNVSRMQNDLQAMMEERNRSVRQRLVCMQVWEHERIGIIKTSFKDIFTIMGNLNERIVTSLESISQNSDSKHLEAIAA